MPEMHAARRKLVSSGLRDRDIEALLVTRLVNVRYLSGFTGSSAALLVTADGTAVLGTDARYHLQAEEEVPDLELLVDRRTAATLLRRTLADGARAVGFEAHDLSVQAHRQLVEVVAEAGSAELVPGGLLVEEQRVAKDEGEIELMRAACAVTERAFRHVACTVRPGMTELEISLALQQRFLEQGAGIGFAPVVAAGPNGARPHHGPTERPVARGDLVVMDFGACYRGYHADMTRTVAVGEPATWQREVYELVAAAQRAGREALSPGAGLATVDEAARAVIRDGGSGAYFTHGLGHGVGLEVHEQPFFSPAATGTLPAGAPVTIEPGVYLPGRGGVRIEDTLVTRAGGPELLTTASKDLLVL